MLMRNEKCKKGEIMLNIDKEKMKKRAELRAATATRLQTSGPHATVCCRGKQ